MSETAETGSTPPGSPDHAVQYALKELEIQFEIEARARDRVENMVQYLLTSFAAIIGAVLLVNEMRVNIFLLLFVALLLVFSVSTSAFYRTCRLRYIITYARVMRNHIRSTLKALGVRGADRMIDLEGNPSGFCDRMLTNLKLFLGLCSLLGGAAAVFALLLGYQLAGRTSYSGSQLVWLVLVPVAVALLVGVSLRTILHNLKRKADNWISDPHWKALPDNEL